MNPEDMRTLRGVEFIMRRSYSLDYVLSGDPYSEAVVFTQDREAAKRFKVSELLSGGSAYQIERA